MEEHEEICMTVSFPVSITDSLVIDNCSDKIKKQKITELFKKAELDEITENELQELKEEIKNTADKIFESSTIKPIIHDSNLDILID